MQTKVENLTQFGIWVGNSWLVSIHRIFPIFTPTTGYCTVDIISRLLHINCSTFASLIYALLIMRTLSSLSYTPLLHSHNLMHQLVLHNGDGVDVHAVPQCGCECRALLTELFEHCSDALRCCCCCDQVEMILSRCRALLLTHQRVRVRLSLCPSVISALLACPYKFLERVLFGSCYFRLVFIANVTWTTTWCVFTCVQSAGACEREV